MTSRSTSSCSSSGASNRKAAAPGSRKPSHEILNTVLFDSKGPRKYAIQLRKASNGNPCLKIIEGIPTGNKMQGDGGRNGESDEEFRRVYLTVWGEDFDAFFKALGDTWRYIRDHGVKTPENHKTPKTMGSKPRNAKGSTTRQNHHRSAAPPANAGSRGSQVA